MKEKRGKAARPKFHILFPIDNITNREDYALLKGKLPQSFHTSIETHSMLQDSSLELKIQTVRL